jgi:hypothetical protein
MSKDPYVLLKANILKQAVYDYKYNRLMRKEVLNFVMSDWFEVISSEISREAFLDGLKKIAPF